MFGARGGIDLVDGIDDIDDILYRHGLIGPKDDTGVLDASLDAGRYGGLQLVDPDSRLADVEVVGLVTFCLAMVLLLLEGSMSLTALGLMSVDVIMKKMSSRNTRSLIDEELVSILILF